MAREKRRDELRDEVVEALCGSGGVASLEEAERHLLQDSGMLIACQKVA